jgi:pyruvate/2-oxoglutarate dehydrogenase complex dihydrolipoamide dehydrogenase (E3) component
MLKCHYLIIGSGETGLILAEQLLKIGKSVALVEKNQFGGRYFNQYDYPKYLLQKESSDFATNLKLFKDYPDTFSVITKYRQKIALKIESGSNKSKNKQLVFLEKQKAFKYLEGTAEFFSKSIVEVNSETERHLISFNECIIATGKTKIQSKEILGLDYSDLLTQENVFLFKEIPTKMAIYGLDKESLEVASIYSGLGVSVTIFEEKDAKKTLPKLDKTGLNYLIASLTTRQVVFLFETGIKSIKKTGKQFTVTDTLRTEHKFSHIYTTVTNEFDGEVLSLKKIGLKYTKKGIQANASGKTNLGNILVFGEANSSIDDLNKLASVYDFLKSKNKSKTDTIELPIFGSYFGSKEITPLGIDVFKIDNYQAVINIGLSETQAISNFGTSTRTQIFLGNLYEGFFKLIYKQNNNQILGIVLTGDFATKLEDFALLVLKKKLTKTFVANYLQTVWGI